ncbi:MAG: glycoside hydrolase family 73 protein [Alphaproteobacteria bacterium]|nr:glycoside hydrolase family 73 protein [Alphaproteobacteria bacterium]
MNQQDFIEAMAKPAQEVQAKYGVPASIAIAQAALESGWGERSKGNNLFGIKSGASWRGATIDMATHEYLNGSRVGMNDKFRAYAGFQQSIEDYGRFLSDNKRYAGVLVAGDANEAADALQRAGYATDPKYTAKLKQIITQYDLTRFDDVSYAGYNREDARFEQTRQRLAEQRDSNPGVWGDFMNAIAELLKGLFGSISAAIFGQESQVATAPERAPHTPAGRPSATPPAHSVS